MTSYMFKKKNKAKILEDVLSDTRAKNVQVQREGERYKERERAKRGRERSEPRESDMSARAKTSA